MLAANSFSETVQTGPLLVAAGVAVHGVSTQRSDEQAVFAARDIWHSINRPNLIENILPTRPRATLVLRKDADHAINRLRLRKL